MPDELRKRVDAEAERLGMTRTAFIVNAMWGAVQRPEDAPVVTAAKKRKAAAKPAAEKRTPSNACPECGCLPPLHFRGCSKAVRR